MTKFRRKPATGYHAFLVEPTPDFAPTNWQDKPLHYRIIEYAGLKQFKGQVDAWRFLFNHRALADGDTKLWAIYVN